MAQIVHSTIIHSLIIPVYKNEASLPNLCAELAKIARALAAPFEVVFVVDASPDQCWQWLQTHLPAQPFASQLLLHSRNFGSFAAIRTGLQAARGQYFAVMAADLQEPPELAQQFFELLAADQADVVIGTRDSRDDPWLHQCFSNIFWRFYRRYVQPEMPPGGVDMFGCNLRFRQELLALQERNSSLVGLLLWLGFRRKTVGYHRAKRQHGKSAWTFRKKLNYLMDSVFAFSDLPLKLLMAIGATVMSVAMIVGLAALIGRLTGVVQVPGYTMLILTISFFSALNVFALGLVGSYVWRAFENTKGRALSVIAKHQTFGATDEPQ